MFQTAPEFGKLYCGESNSQYLAIIDYAADTLIRALYQNNIVYAICYDSARQQVFSVGGRWVSVVDATGDSVIIARQILTGNQMNRDVGARGPRRKAVLRY